MVTAIVVLSATTFFGPLLAYRIGKAVQKSQSKKTRRTNRTAKALTQQPYTGLDDV